MTYWQQGFLLLTPTVKRQSEEWKAHAHQAERLRIFKHFKSDDMGKSRILVKVCGTAEQAKAIVEKHNKRAVKINRGIRQLRKFYDTRRVQNEST